MCHIEIRRCRDDAGQTGPKIQRIPHFLRSTEDRCGSETSSGTCEPSERHKRAPNTKAEQ